MKPIRPRLGDVLQGTCPTCGCQRKKDEAVFCADCAGKIVKRRKAREEGIRGNRDPWKK